MLLCEMDISIPAKLSRDLEEKGFDAIDHRLNSTDYKRENSNTVIKIVDKRDKLFSDFVKNKPNDNPHFIRIKFYKDYKNVDIYKCEYLKPGKSVSENKIKRLMLQYYLIREFEITPENLQYKIQNAPYVEWDLTKVFSNFKFEELDKLFNTFPKLKEAIDFLITRYGYNHIDMIPENIKFRGNVPVLSDVVIEL